MAGNMTLAGNSEFKSWVSQLKKDIRHAQVVYTNLKVYHFLIKKSTTPNRLQRYA